MAGSRALKCSLSTPPLGAGPWPGEPEISDTSRLPSEIARALSITARQGSRKKIFAHSGLARIRRSISTRGYPCSCTSCGNGPGPRVRRFESPSSAQLPVDCEANRPSHVQVRAGRRDVSSVLTIEGPQQRSVNGKAECIVSKETQHPRDLG
jgi:hypothetical protein